MYTYVVRRVLHAIPALLGVTVIIFVALRIMPGDPVSIMFGTQATKIRPEDRAKIEADLGLSLPLGVQYLKWLQDVSTGKLGKSFWRGDTVLDLVIQRGPVTVEIAVLAILLSWVVGIPVGILSALRQNSVLDYFARFFTVLSLAIPGFWLGAMIGPASLCYPRIPSRDGEKIPHLAGNHVPPHRSIRVMTQEAVVHLPAS